MSDANRPISDRFEFLGLLPAYLNGSLATTDRQRMEDALQHRPAWQDDVAFDRLWKNVMQNQKPNVDGQEAWLVFSEKLLMENLIKRKLQFK